MLLGPRAGVRCDVAAQARRRNSLCCRPRAAAATGSTTGSTSTSSSSSNTSTVVPPRPVGAVLPGAERLEHDEVWVPFRWPGQLGGKEVYLSGSWCGWREKHARLRHCSGAGSSPGDWVAVFKMKLGPVEYKFSVDGAWRAAPGDPLVMDPDGNINNQRLNVKNCHLEFSVKPGSQAARSQGTAVSVVGSWSGWRIATPMQREGGNQWSTDLSLPPGDYHFRFMVSDAARPQQPPVMAVSGAYEQGEVPNAAGKPTLCNKLRVGVAPAFYLFYATGWRHCTLHYKLLRDGKPLSPSWSVLPMDDSPSRGEPSGAGSRWKQAIIALPPGADTHEEQDRYSLQFFAQGPRLAGGGSGGGSGGGGGGGGNGSRGRSGGAGGGNAAAAAGPAAAELERWVAPPLADGAGPAELRGVCKVDTPDKAGSTCYLLCWPGGWKLQDGTITKFQTANKPPVLLCTDVDGTMINEHADSKEQFWMDARTREFQEYWESSAALARSVLVYNTGRSKGQLAWLLRDKPVLTVPDVCITAVGTKIFYLPDGMRAFQDDPTRVEWIEDRAWSERLDEGWDLAAALGAAGDCLKAYNRDAAAGGERVRWLDKGQEHPHRVALQVHVSVLDELVGQLQSGVDARQLQARIIISGAGDWRYVDVVHRLAGKLEALEWVRQVYGVPVERCATAGDSCNDVLMLDGRCPAIIVGNAQQELVDWYHQQNDRGRIVLTDRPEASGVLEGLARHGLY